MPVKDLSISYVNENCDRIRADYGTISDFIEMMNSDDMDIPMLDYGSVQAVFFGDTEKIREFKTIGDLLTHCIRFTMYWEP